MTASNKNIVITPNIGNTTAYPNIVYTGNANVPMTQAVADDNSIYWSNQTGQLFSIRNNSSTGTIFSVNDISGIPFISVDASGNISLNPLGGSNIGIGTASPLYPLHIIGNSYSLSSSWVGNLSIINTTPSTNTSSGALIVGGGAGISGELYVGGLFSGAAINGTSLYSSGVISAVGNGIFANLISNGFVQGTSIYSSGPISAVNSITAANLTSNSFVSGTSLYSSGPISTVGNASFANVISNGYVQGTSVYSSGPMSAIGNASFANLTSNGFINGSSVYSSGPISAVGNASFANLTSNGFINGASVYSSGPISAVGTATFANMTSNGYITAASISSSGTISAAGGITALSITSNTNVTIANSAWIGNLSVVNITPATSTITGALTVAGGVGIAGDAYARNFITSNQIRSGNLSITNTTTATSTATGALVVAGGVGIDGNLWVGGTTYLSSNLIVYGNLTISGNETIINSNSLTLTDPTLNLGTGTNLQPLPGDDGKDRGIIMHYYDPAAGDNHSVLVREDSTETLLFLNNVQPGSSSALLNPFRANSVGFRYGSAQFGNLTLSSNLVASALGTGALVIQNGGGASIGGSLYTGGNIVSTQSAWIGNLSITNSTASTSSATGALVVAGGVGIGGNLYVAGTFTASSLNATNAGNVTISNITSSASTWYPTFVNSIPTTSGYKGLNSNIGVTLTTADGGVVWSGPASVTYSSGATTTIGSGGTVIINSNTYLNDIFFGASTQGLYPIGQIKWSNNPSFNYTSFDVGISRNGTNALEINNGNTGVLSTLFAGNVGIGTGSTTGYTNNVLAVFGRAFHNGNIYITNSSTISGIVFADGTFQNSASSGSGSAGPTGPTGPAGTSNYGNANVASYLTNSVLIGNLSIVNTTPSTSNITGALTVAGGVGISGNIYVDSDINISNGNVVINTANTGIIFPDGTFQQTQGISQGQFYAIGYALP